MSNEPLRIGLNATALLSPLTGVGQYTMNLAQELIVSDEIELHLFYLAAWSREIRTEPLKKLTKIKEFIKKIAPPPYAVSRFVQQLKFTQGARHRGLALYHEPNFLSHTFPDPTVITAHDLSWIRFPETHPPQRVEIMNRLFPRCLERADHVITDASFIREEIIAEFGISPERITSVPLAARKIFRPRSAEECAVFLNKNGLSYRDFILCVGTLEPRKNLQLMIRAYAAMPDAFRQRFPLVLVGMKGWLTSSIEAVMQPLLTSGQVRSLGFTSDNELAALYASAKVLVYPSLYEGFGLPPLEAMASGTPVIVSDRSTLPEVVGSVGIQINPHDASQLKDAVLRMTEDPLFWKSQTEASIARANEFSWTRCAQETISIYRRVLAQARE